MSTASKVNNNNYNTDIWKGVESALVSAIRADPKGLQTIKPRLLHLLHNPASVIDNGHIIKSLYKATGLESDSESDSESELDIQEKEEDLDMLADFLEGELLQHEATGCNTTTNSSKFNSTSDYINSDEQDYKHKLELSKQRLRAGYAAQQKAKEQHRIKVINSSAAKRLMLSPKRTITKKITHYTTPKTKPTSANFTATATRQIKCSPATFYPNYSAHGICS